MVACKRGDPQVGWRGRWAWPASVDQRTVNQSLKAVTTNGSLHASVVQSVRTDRRRGVVRAEGGGCLPAVGEGALRKPFVHRIEGASADGENISIPIVIRPLRECGVVG